MAFLKLILTSVGLLHICDAARILAVFSFPSISHQVVYRSLTQELATRGHQLVILTTDPVSTKDISHENITEIDVHDTSYKIWRDYVVKYINGKTDSISNMKVMIYALINTFEHQMNTTEMQKIIHNENEKFDLIITEGLVRMSLGFSHVLKAPVIQINPCGGLDHNYEIIGAPIHPFLYPDFVQRNIVDLSIYDQLTVLYEKYLSNKILKEVMYEENKSLKKIFGVDTPTMTELMNNVDMLFLNVNPIWDSNRPVPPGVVYMGGIHIKPLKPLPEDLNSFFETSVNGVIYISFGTNVNPTLLPPERIKILNNVFSRLPYDILWKWNGDYLPGQPKNVKISQWLPQNDLLRHPKLKLFITQAGLQSTDEALQAGVPLLGIPIITDQWYNAERYVQLEIGLKLDLNTLTEANFENAITTIINNKKYRENVQRLSCVLQDQPQSPLERAIWWIEYVIRNGGARHLRSPAANMSWAEYLALDVVMVLAAIITLTLTSVVACLYFVLHLLNKLVVKKKSKRL